MATCYGSPVPRGLYDAGPAPVAAEPVSQESQVSHVVDALRERLVPWYHQHKRDLPWRHTTDPYKLVAAELMLQQTGVDRIAPRWTRFVERFPSWQAVAAATPGDVIREWQGLGYNRRAVSLHRMARAVVEQYGGALPDDRDELLKLPGVGPYTANAILSFVHGRDVAAIDVNLRRVIGRLAFGDAGAPMRDVEAVAAHSIPPGQSGDWNQALMDFAALQCTLRRPGCLLCPLRDVCRAAGAGEYVPISRPVRVAAERRASYRGSTRYQRGKVVDVLRQLPPGASLAAEEIGAALADDPAAGRFELEPLLAGLARDGLIQLDTAAGRYHLP
jgi:A/G-specific adenine glycosylase